MQGSVSEESGVMTDVNQSIEDTEEKYRKSREGTPGLRKELWISATSLMNKNIHSKSHDILMSYLYRAGIYFYFSDIRSFRQSQQSVQSIRIGYDEHFLKRTQALVLDPSFRKNGLDQESPLLDSVDTHIVSTRIESTYHRGKSVAILQTLVAMRSSLYPQPSRMSCQGNSTIHSPTST